jgi:hypothetical protein
VKKRVMLVCMLDSIHSAHWIERFISADVIIEIYPSKKFRHLHPKIVHVLEDSPNIKLALPYKFIPLSLLGYIDFLLNEILSRFFCLSNRQTRLQRRMDKSSFNFLHALELQGAGYLSANLLFDSKTQLIVTNWGSDIYYFKNLAPDEDLIRDLLRKANRYSAECSRDYALAKELGFSGLELPVIPNSGGNSYIGTQVPNQKELLIVAKCYGGIFGRGELAIKAVSNLFAINSSFAVFFYSVSPEYEKLILDLQRKYPNRVEFSTIRSGKSHGELMEIFKKARIYIGCSLSDGISTSFLEALAHCVFPIQTNTSCANEWTDQGIHASLVSLNLDEISSELIKRANSWQSLEKLTSHNLEIARKLLDPAIIQAKSQTFYDL